MKKPRKAIGIAIGILIIIIGIIFICTPRPESNEVIKSRLDSLLHTDVPLNFRVKSYSSHFAISDFCDEYVLQFDDSVFERIVDEIDKSVWNMNRDSTYYQKFAYFNDTYNQNLIGIDTVRKLIDVSFCHE